MSTVVPGMRQPFLSSGASEYARDGCVRHCWPCDDCGYDFRSLIRFGFSSRIRVPDLCCVCVAAFCQFATRLATMKHRPSLTEFSPLRAVVAPRIESEIRASYKCGDSVVPLQIAINASPGLPCPIPLGPGHPSCQRTLNIAAWQP